MQADAAAEFLALPVQPRWLAIDLDDGAGALRLGMDETAA